MIRRLIYRSLGVISPSEYYRKALTPPIGWGMTRSFHKVMFSAQEVLDLVSDCMSENVEHLTGLEHFENEFLELAEKRSREEQ